MADRASLSLLQKQVSDIYDIVRKIEASSAKTEQHLKDLNGRVGRGEEQMVRIEHDIDGVREKLNDKINHLEVEMGKKTSISLKKVIGYIIGSGGLGGASAFIITKIFGS